MTCCKSRPKSASAIKQYLKILHAAKHDGLETVDDILRWLLQEGKPISSQEVLSLVAAKQQVPSPTEVAVELPDLTEFDSLLEHKDVYDDEKERDNETTQGTLHSAFQTSGLEVALCSYDEHRGAAGAIEGTTIADDSRVALADSGASGEGQMDPSAVLIGVGVEGVRVTSSESHCALDEGCTLAAWEDVATVSVVTLTATCDWSSSSCFAVERSWIDRTIYFCLASPDRGRPIYYPPSEINWFVRAGVCTSRRARCWFRSCCEPNATCGWSDTSRG